MSVIKLIPGLCKLFSFYEEVLEEVFDENDLDSYFSHNISNIFSVPSSNSRRQQKLKQKVFRKPVIPMCYLKKTEQRYILQEQVKLSNKELSFQVDRLPVFVEFFDKASNCLQTLLPKPKSDHGLQNQKVFSLICTLNTSLNIQTDQLGHRSDLAKTILACFRSKEHGLHGNQFILKKMSTLIIVKFTAFTRTDTTLESSVKNLRANTRSTTLRPSYWHRNSIFNFAWNVFHANKMCYGNFSVSLQKRFSMSSMHVPVSGAHCPVWGSNKFVILDVWSEDFFWRDTKINLRLNCNRLLPWNVGQKCVYFLTWSKMSLKKIQFTCFILMNFSQKLVKKVWEKKTVLVWQS